jgi:hypothetical protein
MIAAILLPDTRGHKSYAAPGLKRIAAIKRLFFS